VQIEQDFAVCREKYQALICRPIAAQFMSDGSIALFEFVDSEEGVKIAVERHYRLVSPEELTLQELASYQHRQS
jgi:hypothetical protein